MINSDLNLSPDLVKPITISGKVVCKVMQDLTLYLVGPSEQEFEFLIDFYNRFFNENHCVKYKTAELICWSPVKNPDLTLSGRKAAAAGVRYPYFEPVRQRIRDGRAFSAQIWDGRPIDDPQGSWSFTCQRIHHRSTGLHAFVRILTPLTEDIDTLQNAALELADNIDFFSGHGGLTFTYDLSFKESSLDEIYAKSRRFWGVDIEDLDGTLPLMNEGIKGINRITVLGRHFISGNSAPEVKDALIRIASIPNVSIKKCHYGNVLIIGQALVDGDQHRPDKSLDPYFAIGNELKMIYIKQHPDFPSKRFIENENTLGWIRRFIDPDGWR